MSSANINMADVLPSLHTWVRMANRLGKLAERAGFRTPSLATESLMAQAEQRTGLTNWGESPSFLEPLERLTHPSEDRACLTWIGHLLLRHTLVERLTCRLRIEQALALSPEIRDTPVPSPLLVVGLPRTGTSLLQGLLSQDPASRPMLAWYANQPAPSPIPGTRDAGRRIRRCQREIRRLFQLADGLTAIHSIAAEEPDECLPLLMNALMTDAFGLLADLPHYRDWLDQQDMVPAYRYYRLQLQILQRCLPGTYWVLKSPAHLPNLAAFLEVFPDARIVQLHRDMGRVIPSLLSLRLKVLGLGNTIHPSAVPSLVEQSLASVSGMLDRAETARRQAGTAPVLDLCYDELVRAPLEAIRRIHAHFGLAASAGFEHRARAWLDRHPQGRHGRHHHAPERFGLTRESLLARFGDYMARYHIPIEADPEPEPSRIRNA
jgi:hypothetical protein